MNPVTVTFRISRVLGLLPYSHSLGWRRVNFSFNGYWAFYSFVLISLYMILVVTINYDYIEGGERRGDDWITNPYNMLLYLSQVYLQGLALIVHLFMVTVKRRELSTVFFNISEIRNGTLKPKFTTGVYTVAGIIWVVGCYAAWLIEGSSDQVPWHVFICPMISDVLCLVIIMQFCAVLFSIESGFTQIVATLRVRGPKYVHHLIAKHSLLIRKSAFINKFYSKQLVAVMCLAVINYVGWTYYALGSIFSNKPDYITACSQFQMALYQIFLIAYTCRSCSMITKEAESFNEELFRITTRYPTISSNVKITLYMSLKQTVQFTGCGFFTLEYPLVSSVLGTATTYIVILIQFTLQSNRQSQVLTQNDKQNS